MKCFILLFVLSSFSANACLIKFKVTETWEEEQKKGPLKKTTQLNEKHSIDADTVVRFSYDRGNSNMVFHFKNQTELALDYDEKLFNEIDQQYTRCKG